MPSTDRIAPSSLDLQDYIAATNDASKRSRLAIIALVVGSVLVLASVLNSLDSNWMLQRIRVIADPQSEYVQKKLGMCDNDPRFDKYRDFFLNAALSSYMDDYRIKVPFFGVTLDTNDVGLIGGLGLFMTLGFLWFSLARERDNLRRAFQAGQERGSGELRKMYYLLAMRQVLTSRPQQTGQEWLVARLPQGLVFLPLVAQAAVLISDLWTFDIGRMICVYRTCVDLIVEAGLSVLIFLVMLRCIGELRKINKEWSDKWKDVKEGYPWERICRMCHTSGCTIGI